VQVNRESPTVQLYVCGLNELNQESNFGNINSRASCLSMRTIFAFGMFTYDGVVLKLREAEREIWTRKNDLLLLECYEICFLWKKKARDVYFKSN